MKQAVKTIVDSIEKEIDRIIDNAEHSEQGAKQDFEFGTFTYDLIINDDWDKWEEARNNKIELYLLYVDVTNEKNKTLINLSTEVFNQLETTYTNY